MSYARWGRDSSVYVYLDCSNQLCCCGCHLSKGDSQYFSTSGKLVEHLNVHVAEGQTVPDYTIKSILADFPNTDQVITDENVDWSENV